MMPELEDDFTEATPPLSLSDRRLLTQPYDLSVTTLLEQWGDGTLVLPEIQRSYVWDNSRASSLVESLLLNVPIPVVYFAEDDDGTTLRYLVIDGHQRIQSLSRFANNEFALSGLRVLSELNKKRFHQLSERDQRTIKTRVLRAIIIQADSDPMMKFEVFERLNTGSIALNSQEVRNSTHRGPMTELVKDLTLNSWFRSCIGTAKPRGRMVDNELILRYLAIRSAPDRYRPPLKRFLNTFLEHANKAAEAELDETATNFSDAAQRVHAALGSGAFRSVDRTGTPTDRAINRAIAEAELVAFSWVGQTPNEVSDMAPQIASNIGELFENDDFLDSIQRATGDRSRTLRRLEMIREALLASGLTLSESGRTATLE